MSTDSVLQLDREQRGNPGSFFSPRPSGEEEIDWIKRLLGNSESQEGDTRGEEPWVYVAPNYFVKKSEYQRRFGEIDLEYYRQRMSPELFTAFVRHMGVVPGSPGLDVVELTTLPDF